MAKRLLFTAIIAGVIFGMIFFALHEKLFVREYEPRLAPSGYGDIDGDDYVSFDYGINDDIFLINNFIRSYLSVDTNKDGNLTSSDRGAIKAKSWKGDVDFNGRVDKRDLEFFDYLYQHVSRMIVKGEFVDKIKNFDFYSIFDKAYNTPPGEGVWYNHPSILGYTFKETIDNITYKIDIGIDENYELWYVHFWKNGKSVDELPVDFINDALSALGVSTIKIFSYIPPPLTIERIEYLNIIPGVEIRLPLEEITRRLDVDGNGVVDKNDANMIKNFAIGYIDTFPVLGDKMAPVVKFRVGALRWLSLLSKAKDYDGNIVSYYWLCNGIEKHGKWARYDENELGGKVYVMVYHEVTDDDNLVSGISYVVHTHSWKPVIARSPVVRMNWQPRHPAEQEYVTVNVDAYSEGDIVGYEWYVDGQSMGNLGNEHTFSFSAGMHIVTVVVKEKYIDKYNREWQLTTKKSVAIIVGEEITENQPPVAEFTWTPENPKVGEEVTFDASDSYDPDGYIIEYRWKYIFKGIHQPIEEVTYSPYYNTTKVTNEAGYINVTLTVKDNEGATASITKRIYVRMPYSPVVADFTWYPANPKVGEVVTFDASASRGYIYHYRWYFGDGSAELTYEPFVTHIYWDEGTYTVTLTVYGYTVNQTQGNVSVTKQIVITSSHRENVYYINLFVEPPEGGNVAVEPYMESYPEGTEVTLTALPNEGYAFSRWVVDGAENPASQITITMDSNKTVHAYFVKVRENQYVLEVAVEPPEGGMVVVVPSGGIYDAGTTVYLTAVPSEGYRFSHWEGDVTGGEMLKTVVMDSNKTVVAHFEKIKMIPGFEIPVLMFAILLFVVRRRKNETAKLL